MKLTMEALENNVVIEPAEPIKQTRGGIHLPDGTKLEKSFKGTVIAVGPGRTTDEGKLLPMRLRVGDKVIVSRYSSAGDIDVDGKEYKIVPENQVLLRLPNGW